MTLPELEVETSLDSDVAPLVTRAEDNETRARPKASAWNERMMSKRCR